MSTITTKFSVGDVCYVAIHPTADIIQCIVEYVRIVPLSAVDNYITYKLHRVDIDQHVDYIKEIEVYTFAEAKTELLTWLNQQTVKVTAMTEPPAPV